MGETEMDVHEYLGKLVEQARTEKGWTQLQLADEAGVDVRTIKKVESGTGNPAMDTIIRYIFLLNISPAIMFNQDPCEDGLKMDRLYRELISLSPAEIDLVCKSALHLSKWKENHPDVETLEDYYRVMAEFQEQTKTE